MDIRNAAMLYLTDGAAPSRVLSWATEYPVQQLAWQTAEHKPVVCKLKQQIIGYDAANDTFLCKPGWLRAMGLAGETCTVKRCCFTVHQLHQAAASCMTNAEFREVIRGRNDSLFVCAPAGHGITWSILHDIQAQLR